ncbi:MAG: glycoside hydrolase family 88 protein [Paludibacter sp.]|nr:glycoside hydrolase family 88 protein [Paludibacter sp.]
MKYLSVCLFFFLGFIFNLSSQELPSKQKVLEKMTLANNYFLNKWPDPTQTIVTNKTRPSNLWTRGTYFEGLMQLYYINNNATLYKYAVDWGTFHKWQPTYTGTTPTRIADNQCCFQTYIELYQIEPKPDRIAMLKLSLDDMVNSTKVDDWWWIDALHMAMPVFAKYGNVTSDNKYYEKMFDLYNHTKTIEGGPGLYNPADSLWYRDKDYLPPTVSPNGLPVYWSRGNGWVFAALTRTLDVLPLEAPHREEYLTTFKQMAGKLIQLQRADGFWNCNLGDQNDYGGKETSGTVFYTFGLAWGINHNVLDSAIYYPTVVKGWNGLVNSALHSNGSLGYVQSAGSKPADGQPLTYDKMPDFDDFALGGFLLAGSEVYRLAKDSNLINSNKNLVENTFKLITYPNPGTSSINIQYKTNSKNSLLKIVNPIGQIVYSYKSENLDEVNLRWYGETNDGVRLPNGIYIVFLECNSKTMSTKVFLKR